MKTYRFIKTDKGAVVLDDGKNIHVQPLDNYGNLAPVISAAKADFRKRGMKVLAADGATLEDVFRLIDQVP